MARFPGARIGDMHACPVHGGGPISTGFPTVLVGKKPASRLSDIALCAGVIPDPIAFGSPTVLIGKMPASRMTDACSHGGAIVSGCATVLIGTVGGASAGAPVSVAAPAKPDCLRAAAATSTPFLAG